MKKRASLLWDQKLEEFIPEGALFAVPAQLQEGSAVFHPGKLYPLLQKTSCAVPGEKFIEP